MVMLSFCNVVPDWGLWALDLVLVMICEMRLVCLFVNVVVFLEMDQCCYSGGLMEGEVEFGWVCLYCGMLRWMVVSWETGI